MVIHGHIYDGWRVFGGLGLGQDTQGTNSTLVVRELLVGRAARRTREGGGGCTDDGICAVPCSAPRAVVLMHHRERRVRPGAILWAAEELTVD